MRHVTWKTRISDASAEGIVVRGYDLAELTGRAGFGEVFYLLLRGELPPPNVARMVEAMLVACVDHSIVTTSVAARYAVASGSPLQAALAAGVLMVGDVYAGAVEQAMRVLADTVKRFGAVPSAEAAQEVVLRYRARHETIPGFGHPLHPAGDPRARRLLELADELGLHGPHGAWVAALEAALARSVGRLVPLNADGAVAAVAADLGFDWKVGRAFILLSRSAGILAHACEERESGRGWRLPPPAEYTLRDHEAYYEGPAPRRLPEGR